VAATFNATMPVSSVSGDWTGTLRHALAVAFGVDSRVPHHPRRLQIVAGVASGATVKFLPSLHAPGSDESAHQSVRELFRAHATFVAKFLWRMGAPEHEIEDLVQDVFLIAHSRGGFVKREAKATTWLAAIAFRVWSSERRRFRRHSELSNDGVIARAEAQGPSPAEALATAESLERVRKVLEQIDERSRVILILVDLEGTSCVEVAEALEIPVGTVYSRLHAARKRFARAYGKLGDRTPGKERHGA